MRQNIGLTDEAVIEPLENSAVRNSKMMFSERRNKYGCGRSPSRGPYWETELSSMHTLSRLASSIALWSERAASSGERPRALSRGGVNRARSRRPATRSSKSGTRMGASAFSRGECPP